MLKIYINNEEVIANQNFTIQKHMLNTPSVILNNVCPKTWCDEKDYITNFYHPLDYSKCKIVDETFHPYDPGITTTINQSATLNNVDTTKLYELTQIEGNTTQSGTPTPSSPQPINVVSGRQEILVEGKNLFNKNLLQQGGLDLGGTGIETSNPARIRSNFIKVNPNTQYTISNVDTIINQCGIGLYKSDKSYDSLHKINNGAWNNFPYTFTTQSDTYYVRFAFRNSNNNNITPDLDYKIQLEKGSTPSQYEAYKGQSYEINLGKNLINYNATGTGQGINYAFSGSELSLNQTTTSGGQIAITNTQPITLQAGTYTFSSTTSGTFTANGKSTAIYLKKVSDNTGIITLAQNNNYTLTSTFTLNEETKIYVQVYTNGAGFEFNNFKIKWQIEKGTQSTNWVQYKTPIELCKINTYKDRIYKENGTWYLHKEIGKVVLDGSESGWRIVNTGTNNWYYSLLGSFGATSQLEQLSNYYSNVGIYNKNTEQGIMLITNGTEIRIRYGSEDTISNYKTWLSTHNVLLYYSLTTPTTTEITDTELISQLNAIELLEGLNNISITSGNLPGIMTIHYNFNDAYTTEDLLFCGVVKNSGNISLNPREPHYTTLQVLDFKDFLSSGETLDFVIYQKTILEAIQQVIGTIQDYGFILGNVNILNPNEIIGAYSTKDKTAYDVFNYIADITQSRWTTRMIDENTVAIDFYDPTLMPQGTEIDYTNAYFNDKLIDDMKYSYGTNNYRNKQVMISNQVYSSISQAQTIVANGYQTQFPTEQPIGKINSITSNGIPLTFATFNEKDMGYVADFYYTPGDNYFESDNLRSTGEVLIIDYVAIVEGRQVITNSTEIDRIQESTGRKGIVARYETRNDATTSTELQKIGESYIKYKGTPEIVLTIQSRKNTWEVGQRVQFNAPIDELDTEYMVRSKKINYIANQQENESQLFYTYELISSFNSETEINYFDNQRAKASGNIGEGEYISRNIDIESLAEIIFYDTEATEVQVSGDNELNAILNSPFIS